MPLAQGCCEAAGAISLGTVTDTLQGRKAAPPIAQVSTGLGHILPSCLAFPIPLWSRYNFYFFAGLTERLRNFPQVPPNKQQTRIWALCWLTSPGKLFHPIRLSDVQGLGWLEESQRREREIPGKPPFWKIQMSHTASFCLVLKLKGVKDVLFHNSNLFLLWKHKHTRIYRGRKVPPTGKCAFQDNHWFISFQKLLYIYFSF